MLENAMATFKLPKKRWKRALLYTVSTLCIALAVDMSLTAYWRRIPISRETTYITAPLFEGRIPDYVTYLDARNAAGVTPDNNAAVPLIRAVGLNLPGTDSDSAQWESRTLKALGFSEVHMPCRMLYFVPWAHDQTTNAGKDPSSATKSYAAGADPKWADEETSMRSAPWSAKEHPLWAQWLAAQPEILALAHEAAGRERYYMPAFSKYPPPGTAFAVPLPALGPTRYLGRMLLSDAMMHAEERDKRLFLRDVTDAMKLGVLLRRSTDLVITNLVGAAIIQETCIAIQATLANGDLEGDDQRALLAFLDALPPMPPPDLTGERCGMLDMYFGQAFYGLSRAPFGLTDSAHPKAAALISLTVPVRYAAQMRMINQSFDELDAALAIPNFRQRYDAVGAAQRKLYDQANKAALYYSGYVQATLMVGDFIWAPKMLATLDAADMERDLTRVALALAINYSLKSNYPAALSALTGPGGILKSIPLDGFTDQHLVYRLDRGGYLLYSVGKDLHDDGGDPDKDLVVHPAH
jgi:hypothetical protein